MSICILEQFKRYLNTIPAFTHHKKCSCRPTARQKMNNGILEAQLIRELNTQKSGLKKTFSQYIPAKDQQTLSRTIQILDNYTSGSQQIDFSKWEEDKKYLLDSIELAQGQKGFFRQLSSNAWFSKQMAGAIIGTTFTLSATLTLAWIQQPVRPEKPEKLQGIIKLHGKLRAGITLVIDEHLMATSNQYGEFQLPLDDQRTLHQLQLRYGQLDTTLIIDQQQLDKPMIIKWNPNSNEQSMLADNEKINADRVAKLH